MHRRLLLFDENIQAIKMFSILAFRDSSAKFQKKNTIPLRQYFDMKLS